MIFVRIGLVDRCRVDDQLIQHAVVAYNHNARKISGRGAHDRKIREQSARGVIDCFPDISGLRHGQPGILRGLAQIDFHPRLIDQIVRQRAAGNAVRSDRQVVSVFIFQPDVL